MLSLYVQGVVASREGRCVHRDTQFHVSAHAPQKAQYTRSCVPPGDDRLLIRPGWHKCRPTYAPSRSDAPCDRKVPVSASAQSALAVVHKNSLMRHWPDRPAGKARRIKCVIFTFLLLNASTAWSVASFLQRTVGLVPAGGWVEPWRR